MGAYTELVQARVTTREAAALTGVPRATAHRAAARCQGQQHGPVPERLDPVNKLCPAEREQVLAVLHSPEFIDSTPLQVYARLLDQDTYLCSVSTMYRVLTANQEVKERRRIARHPARVTPELVATGPRAGLHLGHHQAGRPGARRVLRRVRDDRHLLPVHRRGPRAPHRGRGAGHRDDEADLRGARCPHRGAR